MNVLKKLGNAGVVPVVVIEDATNAVPTAEAMIAGGIDVMEITMRTAAALDSIRNVSKQCSEMLVGAGTVITLDQCKASVDAGAKFIVSPGFDKNVVEYCVENNVAIVPGCVTPTEIMMALNYNIKVVKFFPANVYGGLSAMKALSGPFGDVKFIPTGGVNAQNLAEYISAPYVYAVGGSWVCAKNDISNGNFDKITSLCADARKSVLGFELAHIGVNCIDADESMDVCEKLNSAFGFDIKPGSSSNYASNSIEVMKSMYLGKNGHIAIRTNSIFSAIDELSKRGFVVDMENTRYQDNKMIAAYLKDEIGGFAVHLLQK